MHREGIWPERFRPDHRECERWRWHRVESRGAVDGTIHSADAARWLRWSRRAVHRWSLRMRFRSAACFGCGVDAGFVERDVEFRGEFAGKGKVGVGFCTAKTVMEMGGVKHQAQFPATASESREECDGIGSAGKTDGKTHPGFQERGVERESGRRRAHEEDDSAPGATVPVSILNTC